MKTKDGAGGGQESNESRVRRKFQNATYVFQKGLEYIAIELARTLDEVERELERYRKEHPEVKEDER